MKTKKVVVFEAHKERNADDLNRVLNSSNLLYLEINTAVLRVLSVELMYYMCTVIEDPNKVFAQRTVLLGIERAEELDVYAFLQVPTMNIKLTL